ncbi:MAG: 30S ribosomal protein S4 [Verrucomicrobiales bacterium]
MARYTGPKAKISRRFNLPIFGPTKQLERKPYPPGMHGAKNIRKKQSDYALAMAEKQKLKYTYGVLEKQFRRYFEEALRRRGVTGETLLQLLETRLDNVIYRLGLANTRRAARQMVSHGHVLVNSRRVNVASYCVKPGDRISVAEAAKSRQLAVKYLDLTQITPIPEWLNLDKDAFAGSLLRIPSRDDIAPNVNEQLVVELYSR